MSTRADTSTTARRRGPTGLDAGARQAMLRVLREAGVSQDQMLMRFFRAEAYGDLDDYLAAVTTVWGRSLMQGIRDEMSAATDRYTDDRRIDFEQARRDARRIYAPLGLLMSMPEPDFLSLVESAVGVISDPFLQAGAPSAITRICTLRGVSFRLAGAGSHARFEWVGDAVAEELALRPAVSALDDSRLASGPRVDFEDARSALRDGTPTGRRRAVADACSAVESGLKVLLQQHGAALPDKAGLDALIEACRRAGLFPAAVEGQGVPIEQVLVAAGRFGNRRGRHGAGGVPHDVEPDEAEAVVSSAAVALTFIARRLPSL